MNHRLLFLTLNTFSATGGIEKVCRLAGKALHELSEENESETTIYSLYDNAAQVDERYFPATLFKGFSGSKGSFVFSAVQKGRKSDVVLLSHINLLSTGYLIKKASPKTKLVLMAHGIEVWGPLTGLKAKMLSAVDLFLPVSSFTAGKLNTEQNIAEEKIRVLNNGLDPFLNNTSSGEEKDFRKRYGITDNDFVLLTVTRLKFSEQYKGYDRVVEAMSSLVQSLPNIKYVIAGKCDPKERARLDAIIAANGLSQNVVLTGYVKDNELAAHFKMADCYIMPSTGEGFGLVFIEALFYGLPVIAGNADGSVDALAHGEFGLLINPVNIGEIEAAILKVCKNKSDYIPSAEKVSERFGFATYKSNLQFLVNGEAKTAKSQPFSRSTFSRI